MKLHAYLFALARDAREALATACDTSVGHLNNVAYGNKPCSPLLAALLERHTGGRVMRWDLRPHDWREIWPELAGRADAPAVVVAVQQQEVA